MKDILTVVEVWLLQRMLRISWIEKISIDEVLKDAGVQQTLMKRILKWQPAFLVPWHGSGVPSLSSPLSFQSLPTFQGVPSYNVSQESKLPRGIVFITIPMLLLVLRSHFSSQSVISLTFSTKPNSAASRYVGH